MSRRLIIKIVGIAAGLAGAVLLLWLLGEADRMGKPCFTEDPPCFASFD